VKPAELAVVGVTLVGLVCAAALMQGDGHAYSGTVGLTRGIGYVALSALVLALCVTPLASVVRRFTSPSRLRRAFGLAALACGVMHALFALGIVPGGIFAIWREPALRAGALSLLILSLIGLTSFPVVVRAVRLRHWKELHRLAYVALACTLWHALLQPYAPAFWLLALAAACALLLGLRLLPRHRPTQGPSSGPNVESDPRTDCS
jgi:sulfoxide reductase heme-binding subunit YedZ